MNKKAVSGVIVTVLLILLAIAAVVLVATVLMPFIENNLRGNLGSAACLATRVEVIDYTQTSISIARVTSGSSLIDRVKLVINDGETTIEYYGEIPEGADPNNYPAPGSAFGHGLELGEIETWTQGTLPEYPLLENGDEIKVYLYVDGAQCGIVDTVNVEGFSTG